MRQIHKQIRAPHKHTHSHTYICSVKIRKPARTTTIVLVSSVENNTLRATTTTTTVLVYSKFTVMFMSIKQYVPVYVCMCIEIPRYSQRFICYNVCLCVHCYCCLHLMFVYILQLVMLCSHSYCSSLFCVWLSVMFCI